MNKRFHSIGLSKKKQGAAVALCLAFAFSAWAQTPPPLPLPPLDLSGNTDHEAIAASLPPIPGPEASNGLPSLQVMTETSIPKADPVTVTEQAPAVVVPNSVPLADLPQIPAPVETKPAVETAVVAATTTTPAGTTTAPATTAAAGEIPPLPGITTLPGLQPGAATTAATNTPMNTLQSNPLNAPPALNLNLPALTGTTATGGVTPLPEVNVSEEKPKEKTWLTKLEPVGTPMKTNFNYKRVMMPNAIYQSQYEDFNKHLPTALTRQEYEAQLFDRASKNDVVATRALLNAGTNINTRDINGDTPLAVAQRSGAYATANLLIARGGK